MADLLTTRQVQALLRVDRTTIYRMVEGGQLPAIRVGKQWRFTQDEVEAWLAASRSRNAGPRGEQSPARPAAARESDLRSLLPLTCVQLIQDTFAEVMGLMILITDMQGRPVTRISNPCGFFAALAEKNSRVVERCVQTWQQLAQNPGLAPAFMPSELDLLCARGLIRVGAELKGMVVLGGIAPDAWPPTDSRIAAIAQVTGLPADDVRANLDAVYRLDQAAQERALRFVQRIADVFSHIIEDRSQMQGRLSAAAQMAFS